MDPPRQLAMIVAPTYIAIYVPRGALDAESKEWLRRFAEDDEFITTNDEEPDQL